MNVLSTCPLCSSSEITPFLKTSDFSITREEFEIFTCRQCTFKFTQPQPPPEKLGSYYNSEEYISHSDTEKGIIAKLYQYVRRITVKSKIRLLNRYSPKGKLLDFGAGTGFFVKNAMVNHWSAVGIEPEEKARIIAKEKNGVTIFKPDEMDTLEKEKFQVITLWHVLEHVVNLHETIEKFHNLLKPGGWLFIAVPNHLSWDSKVYERYWAAWDVPRHLWHFNPIAMRLLMAKHNFYIINKHPLWFDAFYVSMLSEKYKHGKTRLLSGALRGLISNLIAVANTNLCSSVVYVLKKG
ncbi:MAG: hypothetical protein A3H98_04305 [Bacteroidetes bacterium RIFCSPLOWO2_02_FULL_36_8]|nr:MAG: hypothetical protein A3H98_04305 [Bacteroidetes bacterium RIFCSPLOWO2_02_FULL_36_8]OFY70458.1 MAG: hypothetical protein A3G23_10050 [Bacteroidetes bacterium RIFCSPLOWO2_12_FULL_37_12]